MKYIVVIWLLFIVSSCTVNIPDIKISGEKTALENQILGEYKEMEEDAWILSSERGDIKIEMIADKKEIISAVRNRLFNRDDINEFKKNGVIGEELSGLVAIVNNSDEKLNPEDKSLLSRLIIEENRDREIIMKRIEEIYSAEIKKKGVGLVFYKLNIEESPKGTYFKNEKNEWEKK